jgi:hypothetical protein
MVGTSGSPTILKKKPKEDLSDLSAEREEEQIRRHERILINNGLNDEGREAVLCLACGLKGHTRPGCYVRVCILCKKVGHWMKECNNNE